MTVVRRTLAFATDSAILLLTMGGLLMLVHEGLIEWSAPRDMVLLAAVVAGFAFSECRSGQTPGKKLWRVWVLDADGRPPAPPQALLRAGLFFLPPVLLGLLVDFVKLLVYVPEQVGHFLYYVCYVTLLLIPPVSIIAGRGAAGLHDWLSGCHVEFCHPSETARARSAWSSALWNAGRRAGAGLTPRVASPRIMAMSTLLSLILAITSGSMFAQVVARMPIMSEAGQAEMRFVTELMPTPLWFDQQIMDAEHFVIAAKSQVILGIPKPAFERSWMPALPEPLRNGSYAAATLVGYKIALRPGAATSAMQQLYLARALTDHTARYLGDGTKGGFVVDCEFITESRVGFLSAGSVRRLVGGTAVLPDGSTTDFMLEPDAAASFRLNFDATWRGELRAFGQEES
jgi:hypothetical protein